MPLTFPIGKSHIEVQYFDSLDRCGPCSGRSEFAYAFTGANVVGMKRSLALGEFALGREALEGLNLFTLTCEIRNIRF